MKTTSKIVVVAFTFLALAANAYEAYDNPLFKAIEKGNKTEVEALLAKGADVNAKTNREWTPLHQALYFDRKEIAELLLAYMLEQARRNPRVAFVVLNEQLKDHPADKGNRRLIIKLASELKPAPAIPKRHANTSSKAPLS